VRTAEWCLPLDQMDAALADVIDTANKYVTRHKQYCLLPIYVRIAKTDELLLSPANKKFSTGETEHCCYIEVNLKFLKLKFLLSNVFNMSPWLGRMGNHPPRYRL
jgi:hypothetical protein